MARHTLGWDNVTLLADLDRVADTRPSPFDEASERLDGPEPEPRSRTLQLLDAMPQGALRDAVWLALLRGEAPTQAELARRVGLSQQRVSQMLQAAWRKVTKGKGATK